MSYTGRTSENSPQIREPLEALIDPRVRLVFIIAAIASALRRCSPAHRPPLFPSAASALRAKAPPFGYLPAILRSGSGGLSPLRSDSLRSVQAGKTSVGELGLCHIIANLPGPTLWLDQTDDDAKDQADYAKRKSTAQWG